MCTLSWVPEPSGYTILFSRDERRDRMPAIAPSEGMSRGIRFLAPRDPDAGGTWIGVNERGVTLAMLNRYDVSPLDSREPNPVAGSVSRGLLLAGLLDVESESVVDARLRGAELGIYRPFTLVVFAAGAIPQVREWDGQALSSSWVEGAGLAAASSSAGADVAAQRASLFGARAAQEGRLTADLLERLHRAHVPDRGAVSVCMHRAEAVTVSFSRVTVTGCSAAFGYSAGSPCEEGEVMTRVLPMRGVS
ncbi:MAG: NRDE family protein [Gemmatimonadota bacterium]